LATIRTYWRHASSNCPSASREPVRAALAPLGSEVAELIERVGVAYRVAWSDTDSGTADDLGPVRAFSGMSWDERLTTRLPDSVTLMSYGALGALRALSKQRRLQVVPCDYSDLPRLFARGLLPCDVGFVQVSPPDSEGCCYRPGPLIGPASACRASASDVRPRGARLLAAAD